MNRAIKFRAWDSCHHKMIDWEKLQYTTPIGWENKIIPMQFTGLLDKNGGEIYEGDIIECREKKYTVISSRACFVLKEIIKNNDIRISMQDEYQMKIIGNIYQNPELLN